MRRKLAVPLALSGGSISSSGTVRSRTLRIEDDANDLILMTKIAANRGRIERLKEEVQQDYSFESHDELMEELEFLKANIQLEFLGITGELEGLRSSEEVFEEAIA